MSMALTTPIITTEAGLGDLALVSLLRLVSPALPIGAFAWSQGQEYAIDSGQLTDAASIEAWIRGILQHNLTGLDLPLLLRLHRAVTDGDTASLITWNDYTLASRETKELHDEDTYLGQALYTLLNKLALPVLWTNREGAASLLTAFAEAAVISSVPTRATLLGWLWSWLENQIAVAGKALPLGQTQAQGIVQRLLPLLPDCVDRATEIADDDLGCSFPGFAITSARHERQYSRLFRS